MEKYDIKKLRELLDKALKSDSDSDYNSDSIEISGEALNAKAKLRAPAKHIGSLSIIAVVISLVLVVLSLQTQAEEARLAHYQIRKQVSDITTAIRFQTCIFSLPVEARREEFKHPYECNSVRF